MCKCVCVCMYVYVCVCVRMCTYINIVCIRACVGVWVCDIRAFTYIYIYITLIGTHTNIFKGSLVEAIHRSLTNVAHHAGCIDAA